MIRNNNSNNILQLFCLTALLCVFTLPIYAAVPDHFDYQGYLTDAGGSPINGTFSITFKLYDVDMGGIEVYSNTHAAVDLTNGYLVSNNRGLSTR